MTCPWLVLSLVDVYRIIAGSPQLRSVLRRKICHAIALSKGARLGFPSEEHVIFLGPHSFLPSRRALSLGLFIFYYKLCVSQP